MFTNTENNAKMAWDYRHETVCLAVHVLGNASFLNGRYFKIKSLELIVIVYDLKSVGPLEFKLVAPMPEQLKTTAMHFYEACASWHPSEMHWYGPNLFHPCPTLGPHAIWASNGRYPGKSSASCAICQAAYYSSNLVFSFHSRWGTTCTCNPTSQ